VVLTAGFAILSLVYSGLWWTGKTDGRLLLGAAAGAAGIAAVIAAAAVYAIPASPAWNSGWVPASFLGTALLLGGFAPAVLIPWRGNPALLRIFLGASVAGSLLLLVAVFWTLANVSRSLKAGSVVWLGCHVALASVLPIAVAFRLWPDAGAAVMPFARLVLAAVLCGAAIGRAVMYWLGTRYEPF
jgi:DMSO reductase anchor subunit